MGESWETTRKERELEEVRIDVRGESEYGGKTAMMIDCDGRDGT